MHFFFLNTLKDYYSQLKYIKLEMITYKYIELQSSNPLA